MDYRSIPRKCLDRELNKLHLKGITLDIGSKRAQYSHICDELIALDIQKTKDIDVVADAHCLPFKKDSFDNILMINLLEHVQDPQKVIDETHRVVRQNGLVVVYTPFMYPIHGDPNDYYRFTKDGLRYYLGILKL